MRGISSRALELSDFARELLAAKHPMSLRQLHYEIFSAATIDYQNAQADYKRLGRVTTDARRRYRQAELDGDVENSQNAIPYLWMVDELRVGEMVSVWQDAAAYIEAVRDSYRRDLWQDQPAYCEVWNEKATVLGSLRPVTQELGVMLRACRGFGSAPMEFTIGTLFEILDKPIHVFYLGDHDPSGLYRARYSRYLPLTWLRPCILLCFVGSSSSKSLLMATTPSGATPLTTRETLTLMDGVGSRLFNHFEKAGYVLWLGSGISRERVPPLADVVRRVLAFLQTRMQPANPDCKFRTALIRALRLVLSNDDLAALDVNQPVAAWADLPDLLDGLTGKYADLLDIVIDGEDDDYLLWEGVRVTEAFADPTLEPDAEHLCIAMLALEGLLPNITTANWDGLIEKAVAQLAGNGNIMNVCVRPEDVREAGARFDLYKFHGCAVLARHNETTYRPYLIARKSQIDQWRDDHPVLVQNLINIIRSRATLMIGLSAQDSNIRSAFAVASTVLNWPWPGEFPAIAFSQPYLGNDQLVLLKNVYRDQMTPANRDQVQADSHIPTYAKQLLLALVLKTLSGKFKVLLDRAQGVLPAEERDHLAGGIIALRNVIADATPDARYDFVRLLIEHFSRLIGIFRNGVVPDDSHRYGALTISPASHIEFDPAIPAGGLQELAVAIATLGIGLQRGLWTVHLGSATDPKSGALEIQTPIRRVRIFFAASVEAELKLFGSGRLSPTDDGVIIHSKSIIEAKPRSPVRFEGRTGKREPRAVSMSILLEEASTVAELTERFQREVVL